MCAGSEERGGEDGAAVEGEAQEGLVVRVDEGRGNAGDRELAGGDGAGEEEILCDGIYGDGGDAGTGDEGGEENAVACGSELGEEAGGGVGCGGNDVGDEGVEGGVAGGGGVAGDVGVVGGVGGDGGGGGVVGLAVGGLAAEVGGVEEGCSGGVELFYEAVLEGAECG